MFDPACPPVFVCEEWGVGGWRVDQTPRVCRQMHARVRREAGAAWVCMCMACFIYTPMLS